MILTLATGLIMGSLYWNEQQAFGMILPKSKTYCSSTVEGAPDRGMIILLRAGAVCPDENTLGILDYVEINNEPAIVISSSYNTPDDFKDSRALAYKECGASKLLEKNIALGKIYSCKRKHGTAPILSSFIQVRREKEGYSPVNIEITLRSSRTEDIAYYWETVRSVTIDAPKQDPR
jgi:hypothetical protein